MRTYAFRGEGAWHPPDNAPPSNFLYPKSLDQDLSADVSFVSVLAMVLSEYWKKLENFFFEMILFLQFSQNNIILKKKNSSFFQYSERTIASTEANDTSKDRSDTQLFAAGKSEGVALAGGLHAYLPQKANLILMLWGKSGVKHFEFENKTFSFCQT